MKITNDIFIFLNEDTFHKMIKNPAIKKIYLSRHGEILANKLYKETGIKYKPEWKKLKGYYDLTKLGKKQASYLGKYLQSIITDPKEILFISSKLKRSVDTINIVAKGMKIKLGRNNYQSSEKLNEEASLDFLTKKQKKASEPEWLAKRRNSREVGKDALRELKRIISETNKKIIVAVLHADLNKAMLKYLGVVLPKNQLHQNCWVYSLNFVSNKINKITFLRDGSK